MISNKLLTKNLLAKVFNIIVLDLEFLDEEIVYKWQITSTVHTKKMSFNTLSIRLLHYLKRKGYIFNLYPSTSQGWVIELDGYKEVGETIYNVVLKMVNFISKEDKSPEQKTIIISQKQATQIKRGITIINTDKAYDLKKGHKNVRFEYITDSGDIKHLMIDEILGVQKSKFNDRYLVSFTRYKG